MKYNPQAEDKTFDYRNLTKISKAFFSTYGTVKLIKHIKNLSFEGLLETCGFKQNEELFFETLLSAVREKSNKNDIRVNNIRIPGLYLYHLLEAVYPGSGFYPLQTFEQLEKKAAGLTVENNGHLQQVMDSYPVRLSDHVIRQSLVSENVKLQYFPFEDELDPTGEPITFDGHFKKGIVEQMYENRVVFLLDMQCPVYCRFCFRKHKSSRKEKTPKRQDVLAAVDHVGSNPMIKEVLITGGEPLINQPHIETAINGLNQISHLDVIRIATRSVAYYPQLFLKDNNAYLNYLIEKNRQCRQNGKRIEIGVHFVHPDEISVHSLEIISRWVENGIQVYVQTPFLNGLNTDAASLGELFTLLRNAGAEIYYVFAPCSPIHGTLPFWAPISTALDAKKKLRQTVSDRCIPKFCTATPLGKIEWGTSGWAVKKDEQDPSYTWIRTPYTLSYFQRFISQDSQMPPFRQNSEGTLDAKFRVDMGRSSLFCGSGSKSVAAQRPGPKAAADSSPDIRKVRRALFNSPQLNTSFCPSPEKELCRLHPCGVRINADASPSVLDYIQNNPGITEVQLVLDNAGVGFPEEIAPLMTALGKTDHICHVRLCSRWFADNPERIDKQVIKDLVSWSNFSAADPFRIEIETWFLTAEDIGPAHEQAALALLYKGIGMYANVPLISGINDTPKDIVALADHLRKAGIDFHHLYVDGLEIQKQFNRDRPLDEQQLIHIASTVRTACSGRQIPLYITVTEKGEQDADLTSFFWC